MSYWPLIIGILIWLSGYVSGRIDFKEKLVRRFWDQPSTTMDWLRHEARKRFT